LVVTPSRSLKSKLNYVHADQLGAPRLVKTADSDLSTFKSAKAEYARL
jgi:hypothetical protein